MSVRRLSDLLLALLLATFCGCVAPSPDPPGAAEPSALSHTLSQDFWGQNHGFFQGRYSAVLEEAGQVVSLQGVLQLDTDRQQARLVALSDLGMRLFDVVLTRDDTLVQAALPHYGLSRLRKRVATALRRMLISHLPGPRDRVLQRGDILLRRCLDDCCLVSAFAADSRVLQRGDILLRRCLDDCCLVSAFAADSRVLRYKSFGPETSLWRAEFGDYGLCGDVRVPARLTYADDEQGFTLTLAWQPKLKDRSQCIKLDP